MAADIREPWRLFRAFREAEYDVSNILMTCRHIALDKTAGRSTDSQQKVISRLHGALAPLMPGTSANEFAAFPIFETPDDDDALPIERPNGIHVEVNGQSVIISVDTVAMAKGETHLATLYLECFGHPSRRFDVAEALRRLTGRPAERKPPGSLPNLLRHVYVGASRPSRFLCLSINSSRLVAGDLDALTASGWRVLDVA
ncbi:hypothetical protein [Luteibacter anthropi]|uniref:Uncharacterized protein n=1 Tax=Luteibacter anthropi TaxID=564369 RepID=A0A7X5UAS1_9GAMM|nr:hypothetical protein [Luteibacter anthropi]NII06912.1 hypothetical protein [Luteibacter anthropi]